MGSECHSPMRGGSWGVEDCQAVPRVVGWLASATHHCGCLTWGEILPGYTKSSGVGSEQNFLLKSTLWGLKVRLDVLRVLGWSSNLN